MKKLNLGISSQAALYIGTELLYGVAMGIMGFVLNLFAIV